MTGVRNQGHRIAGEAKDYLKDHEGRVEADAYRKGGSETRRSMDVSAGPMNVVDVIDMGAMMRIRMGHEISNRLACFGLLNVTHTFTNETEYYHVNFVSMRVGSPGFLGIAN